MGQHAWERCVRGIVAIVAFTGLASGCGPTGQYVWTRPGAHAGELERDRYDCVKENTTTITSAAGDQSTVNQVGSNRTDWNMVDMCLQARGWQQTWQSSEPPSGMAANGK